MALRTRLFSIFFIFISGLTFANEIARPNFVWLISEDNGADYSALYSPQGAVMPNIEKLAETGIVFDNAYANSPVCSTSRSTLALGVYAPSYQLQQHRSFRKVSLGNELKPLSWLLKHQGYYTTNKTKEDYNFNKPDDTWDDSSKKAHWRNRKAGQPFFHVQSFDTTHESRLHFPPSDITKESNMPRYIEGGLPAPLPATALMKYTYQRYLQQHQKLDQQLGKVIQQLTQDNLINDTFIFYFGDHGGALPMSKGYLNDQGLRVPLVVHVPANFASRVDEKLLTTERSSRLISFVDFAPSVLALAELPPHKPHQGADRLSDTANNIDGMHYYYTDRLDEKYDTSRGIRVGRLKYVRHFMPHYPEAMFNNYRYKQAAYRELQKAFRQGALAPEAASFFTPKPSEQLFDLHNDPYELNNLVSKPEYANHLSQMRRKMDNKILETNDLSLFPESIFVHQPETEYQSTIRTLSSHLKEVLYIANLQTQRYKVAKTKLQESLNSKQRWHRFWAVIVLSHYAEELPSKQWQQLLKMLNTEQDHYVRGRLFELLAANGKLSDTTVWQYLYASSHNATRKLELLNIAAYVFETTGLTLVRPEVSTQQRSPTEVFVNHKSIKFWIDKRWGFLESKLNYN